MTLKTKKEQETWENFVKTLKVNLPVPSHTWVDALAPAVPIFENTDEIFLIKSNQTFGIDYLQKKHLKQIEESFFEATNLKRPVRFVHDATLKIKKKQPKQTTEEKQHEQTAIKMENLAQMILAGLAAYLVISLIWYIIMVVANWRIFTKAGEAGWKSIIPVLNTYVLFKIAWNIKMFWIMMGTLIAGSICTSIAGEQGGVLAIIGAVFSLASCVVGIIVVRYGV